MSKLPMHTALHDPEHLYVCPMQQCIRPRVLSLQVMTAKKRQKVEAGLMIPAFIIHPYDFQ